MATILAVLLFLLKAIGILLLVLLFLVLLILIFPAWVHLKYEKGKFTAAVQILGFKYTVFPMKKRKRKKKQGAPPPSNASPAEAQTQKPLAEASKEEKPQPAKTESAPHTSASPQTRSDIDPNTEGKAQQGEKETPPVENPLTKPSTTDTDGVEKQPTPEQTKEQKKKFELTFSKVISIISTATGAMKRVLRHLMVRDLQLFYAVHGKDPAKAAITFGRIHAGFYSALALLQNAVSVEADWIHIEPRFFQSENEEPVYFYCRIGERPLWMAIAGIWALIKLKREKVI